MPTASWSRVIRNAPSSIRIIGPSRATPARPIRTGRWAARAFTSSGPAAMRPRLGAVALGLLAALLLAACKPKPQPDELVLTRAGFGDLPGWAEDDPAAALPALVKSCQAIAGRKDDQPLGLDMIAADWRGICTDAAGVTPGDARHFFETRFVPFRASNHGETEGLFTGYYEAALKGSRQPDEHYRTPLYKKPTDLIQDDLVQNGRNLKGERIAGKVTGGKLVPYADRSAIEAGALAGLGL